MEKRYFMNFRFWAYFLLLTNKWILLYFFSVIGGPFPT